MPAAATPSMLGPTRLATRGLANSVAEMLRRLPERLKEAQLVHYHGGKQSAELRESLKDWFARTGALQSVSPPTKTSPASAEFAVFLPCCEVAPVALARYLLSPVPFAMLAPADLLLYASAPNIFPLAPHKEIAARLTKAGKITILATQMTWVLGNLADCTPVEIFSASLSTPAPITALSPLDAPDVSAAQDTDDIDGALPRTVEAWIRAQKADANFDALLDTICRGQSCEE
jgi:hypothetical protein